MAAYVNYRSLYEWINEEIERITKSENYSKDKIATLTSVRSRLDHTPQIIIHMEKVKDEDVHKYI